MTADDTRFSVPAVWNPLLHELYNTPWEDEDLDNAVHGRNNDIMAAALALRAVYKQEWKGCEAEDGVKATLKAAREFHGGTFLTPRQVKDMVAHFAVHYSDIQVPMDDYLDEHCGPVGWHWLNQHGQQQVREAVIKASELWIEDVNVSNEVWVFNKPGHST